ncbi:hypothetical protein RvY_08628 [Ramazzottius varieornatus]|uniref:Uncharacterized protein n=1 Tax=Ramazzottius varieornatus TaxID=947166 RepID=A0A1D1VFQ7_RAMVA|nr:hypothetical protein RvY_08628 [Ramazzottius varieornatus]
MDLPAGHMIPLETNRLPAVSKRHSSSLMMNLHSTAKEKETSRTLWEEDGAIAKLALPTFAALAAAVHIGRVAPFLRGSLRAAFNQ